MNNGKVAAAGTLGAEAKPLSPAEESLRQAALEYHRMPLRGKISVTPTKALSNQRDLSLALGYAGLDPMRIRHWPTEDEMAELFRDVTVAADEHLAGAAGDLTLGELVTMLGRRADGLAEVWNHWGRLRPLLLEEG